MQPVLVTQGFGPKRVGKESNVTYDIGVRGEPVFEAERFNDDVDLCAVIRPKRVENQSGRLVGIESGGVDDDVGMPADRFETSPFRPNSIDECAATLQWVWPTNALEPLNQLCIGRIEKQNSEVRFGTKRLDKRC